MLVSTSCHIVLKKTFISFENQLVTTNISPAHSLILTICRGNNLIPPMVNNEGDDSQLPIENIFLAVNMAGQDYATPVIFLIINVSLS